MPLAALACSPATLDLSHGQGENSPGLQTGYEITPATAYDPAQTAAAAADYEARAPQRIYLSFEGEKIIGCSNHCSDAATNRSWVLGETKSVPAFDHTPYGKDRAAVIADLVARVRTLYQGFNVEFTTTRPTAGAYTLIVVGGDATLMNSKQQVVSSSPADCGNRNRSDVGFVFANAFALGVDLLAVNVAHETGHTLGLSHVDRPGDVMYKYLQAPASFSAEALPVVAADGACPGATTQNASDLLRRNVGTQLLPPGPTDATRAPRSDFDPPAVNVISPMPNTVFPQYTEVAIEVEVEDASSLASVELVWLWNGSRKLATAASGKRYQFRLLVGAGERQFQVLARDAAGNERITPATFIYFE